MVLIGLIIIIIVIPILVQANTEQSSINTAKRSLEQFKVLRGYYTDNVIRKAQGKGGLVASYDHRQDPNKIPLPATMIHDLSEEFSQEAGKFRLYSMYPFANRASRRLDDFQRSAWDILSQQSEQLVTSLDKVNDRVMLRVAISDQMQVQACIDCHNSHPLSPKRDWRLQDVRGVLELEMDITSQIELAKTLSTWIVLGLTVATLILSAIFVRLTRKVTGQISNVTQAMNRLSHGDQSVQVSAMASSTEVDQMVDAFGLFKGSLIEQQRLEKQKQEFETEKINSLGCMVAGVAHEVGTPLGIGVTATTLLQDKLSTIKGKLDKEKLTKHQLDEFIKDTEEALGIVYSNLYSASNLIQSFKQVSVDQVSEKPREINLCQYFQSIIQTLKPEIKRSGALVNLKCDESFYFYTYPGGLSQVLTNLITNSINHGFEERNDGNINISIAKNEDEGYTISYVDDGKGIPEELLSKVMEPLFTTRRDKGGSGLGLSIVHNIITQELKGTIEISSKERQGVAIKIRLPKLL